MSDFTLEATQKSWRTDGSDANEPVYSAFADDPDFAELVEFFVDAIPERCEMLQENHRQNKSDELRTIAHQLKGAGGGYGFDDLSAHAARLEQACKDNDVEAVGESLDVLLGYMSRITV
ncbi:MAG: Hpt domain-containing protein [Planctomycetaceae bacterium]|nr:Hpt domain-containing protein [Planctomycetaceae bacterium]